MQKLAVLCVRQDPENLPPDVLAALAAQHDTTPSEVTVLRTDPTTPQAALEDTWAKQEESALVVNFLRPDPLPKLLLERGEVVTFLAPDGQLMRLRGFTIEAEPYFPPT